GVGCAGAAGRRFCADKDDGADTSGMRSAVPTKAAMKRYRTFDLSDRNQSTVLPWLDAAPNFLPVLAIVTLFALTLRLPFFAMLPSTITSSPIFMVSFVHPEFRRLLGRPFQSPNFQSCRFQS